MNPLLKKVSGAFVGAMLLAGAGQAQAVQVDLELLLLADVSGSLNDDDFNLQRDGYEAAFRDANVISAITNLAPFGGVAVSLVYWSTGQAVAVPWTQLTDGTSSNAFADAIAAAARPNTIGNETGMTAAIDFGNGVAGGFSDNDFEGSRLTIDISGDGAESVACNFEDENCVPLQTARDNSLAQVINALWIEDEAQPSPRDFFCLDPTCDINPLDYGTTNVLKGGGFQVVVANFEDFEEAVTEKIFRELTRVPEPSALILMGIGLLGLGFAGRGSKA